MPDCSLSIAVYFNRGFVGQRSLLDRLIGAAEADELGIGGCTGGTAGSE